MTDGIKNNSCDFCAMICQQREPDLEFGAIYTARVVEVRDYGVMVQLFPTMQPTLIHNSQLDQRKVSADSCLSSWFPRITVAMPS